VQFERTTLHAHSLTMLLVLGAYLKFLTLIKQHLNFLQTILGTIFIDETSIPNSDIYDIFPRLFKQRQPKRLPGFQDFILKLKSMGLLHHTKVSSNPSSSVKREVSKPSHSEEPQWWYIGD